MKKGIKILLLIMIVFIPIILFAELSNYDLTVGKANNYITAERYKDRNKYLLIKSGMPFQYDNDGLKSNSRFYNGGLLNKKEYDLSIRNENSYLATGLEYWTMTSLNSSDNYYIENYISTKSKNETSGARVTEFVKKETKVSGSGTYVNPWVFDETPLVTIRTNSLTFGSIEGELFKEKRAEPIISGGIITKYYQSFDLVPQPGFKYLGHDGCGLVYADDAENPNKYTISRVSGDVDCTANFGAKTYTLSLYKAGLSYTKEPNPRNIYYKYLSGWFKNSDASESFSVMTQKPEITGYTFDGYYYTDNNGNKIDIIGSDGKIVSSLGNNTTIFNNLPANQDKIDLDIRWKANVYKVTLNPAPGSGGTTEIYVKYGNDWYSNSGATNKLTAITKPTRTGYTFDGYYTPSGTKIIDKDGKPVANTTTLFSDNNAVLESHWSTNSYTVTFNVNGGNDWTSTTCSTSMFTFNSSSKSCSKSVEYAGTYGDLPTPTKTGYTFDGWYSGSTKITSSSNVSITAAQTLTAKWTAKSFTITFNVNGGDAWTTSTCPTSKYSFNSSSKACTKSVTYDGTFGDLPTPTRTGYRFDGWYNGSTKITSSSAVSITAAATLTAKWTANSYTITFDKNGGNDFTTTSCPTSKFTFNSSTKACSKSVTYAGTYGDLPTPTKTGSSFGGWYNGSTKITSSSTVSITADTILKANWNTNSYTITFDVSGGDAWTTTSCPTSKFSFNSSSKACTKNVTYAGTFGDLPTPTRTGYTFAGWYNGSTKITSSSTVSITAATTLTAHWTANTYTITFNVNGGDAWTTTSCPTSKFSFNSSSKACTKSVTYAGTFGDLPTPTRTGYRFDGWYNGSTKITSSSAVSITAATTLTAKWTANTYTITFDKNGGNDFTTTTCPTSKFSFNSSSKACTKTVTYASTYGDLPSPTRSGYAFGGWYNGSTQITSSSTVSITADTILKANWNTQSYTITFDVSGGNAWTTSTCPSSKFIFTSSSKTCTKSVANGSKYGDLPTPTRTGYTFEGWYSGSTKITSTTTASLSAAQTLTAKWTANSYSVIFDVSGGNAWTTSTCPTAKYSFSSSAKSCSKSVTYAGTFGDLPTPTRTGYAFAGWYNGSTKITSSSTVSITAATTLTAKWTANTYTITFNVNGGNAWTTTTCPTSKFTFTSSSKACTKSVTYAGKYGDMPTPTRSNYTFDGWYNGSNKITSSSTVSITAATTLTAHWTENTPTPPPTEIANCFHSPTTGKYYKIGACVEFQNPDPVGGGVWDGEAYTDSACTRRDSDYDIKNGFMYRSSCPRYDQFTLQPGNASNQQTYTSNLAACTSAYQQCAVANAMSIAYCQIQKGCSEYDQACLDSCNTCQKNLDTCTRNAYHFNGYGLCLGHYYEKDADPDGTYSQQEQYYVTSENTQLVQIDRYCLDYEGTKHNLANMCIAKRNMDQLIAAGLIVECD